MSLLVGGLMAFSYFICSCSLPFTTINATAKEMDSAHVSRICIILEAAPKAQGVLA